MSSNVRWWRVTVEQGADGKPPKVVTVEPVAEAPSRSLTDSRCCRRFAARAIVAAGGEREEPVETEASKDVPGLMEIA